MDWQWGSQGAPSEDELASQREDFLTRGREAQTARERQVGLPLSELYRAANMPAEMVAPGSREMAQFQVGERTAPLTEARLRGQRTAETMRETGVETSPAVSALREVQAQQKAYPASATAAGYMGSAELGAEQRGQEAQLEALQTLTDSEREQAQNLLDNYSRLLSSGYLPPEQAKVIFGLMLANSGLSPEVVQVLIGEIE